MNKTESKDVAGYLDDLQRDGIYATSLAEIERHLDSSHDPIRLAIWRLKQRGRIIEPREGFLVLIPLEYQNTRAVPPSWFIHDLMAYLQQPYYVGLLSAAGLHGAAHHQPQEFQVITTGALRPIRRGRIRIRFATKKRFDESCRESRKTETGMMWVSTPEETAFDLVRYHHLAGHLDHVASVLVDLGQALNPDQLPQVAEHHDLSTAQKLGFLLEKAGWAERTESLRAWLSQRDPSRIPLSPREESLAGPLDQTWKVIVNRTINVQA